MKVFHAESTHTTWKWFLPYGETQNTRKEVGKRPKRGVFLWHIWHSLPCFSQALACHDNAHCHGHSHRTNICQFHAHNRPVVNGGMQRHILTLAISLIEISSYPARTSILTPTVIMTKGRYPQAGTQRFRSPKAVDEVTSCLHHPSPWTAKTLKQQLLNHCSLWANETRECASKRSAYVVVISLLIHKRIRTVQTTGRKNPSDVLRCAYEPEPRMLFSKTAEEVFPLPTSYVAAVPKECSKLRICSSKLTDLPGIKTCTAVSCCYRHPEFLVLSSHLRLQGWALLGTTMTTRP